MRRVRFKHARCYLVRDFPCFLNFWWAAELSSRLPVFCSQRKMNWTWKGEYIPATRTEYELVKSKLETEWIQKGIRLPEAKQRKEIQKRLKQYSQTVYKKQKVKEEEERYVAAYIKPDLRTNPAHLLLL